MRSRICLFVILFGIIPFYSSYSNLPADDYVIVLKNKKTEKIKIFRPGKKIKVKMISTGKSVKGTITAITENSIFLDIKEIDIEDIYSIRISYKGTKVIGALVGTAGLMSAGLGYLFISSTKGEGMGEVMGFLIGLPFVAAGGVAIISAVPTFFIGRRFVDEKKWEISIMPFNKLYR